MKISRKRSTADKSTGALDIKAHATISVNRKGLIMLHDNARPQVAQRTLQNLQELRFITLPKSIFTCERLLQRYVVKDIQSLYRYFRKMKDVFKKLMV